MGFAAKSGRMAAEEIVALTAGGTRLPTEQEIKDTYIKKYDRAYGPTYLVLDVLQKVFYTNNGAREASWTCATPSACSAAPSTHTCTRRSSTPTRSRTSSCSSTPSARRSRARPPPSPTRSSATRSRASSGSELG